MLTEMKMLVLRQGSRKQGKCKYLKSQCFIWELKVQVNVTVSGACVCPSVFSVDCSTVECPSVQQAVCPLDSYETQVRLTADGCCTLPTRSVYHLLIIKFSSSVLCVSITKGTVASKQSLFPTCQGTLPSSSFCGGITELLL